MKKLRFSLSLLLCTVLLCGLLCPTAYGMRQDLSDVTITMKDFVREQGVTFDGGDGQPKLLMIGGFGSCIKTEFTVKNLLAVLREKDAEKPQVFLLDNQGNSEKRILSVLGDDPLPDCVCVCREKTCGCWMGGRSLSAVPLPLNFFLQALYEKEAFGYTMPLMIYVDKNGSLVHFSEAEVSGGEIKQHFSEIGSASAAPKQFVYEETDEEPVFASFPVKMTYAQTEARKALAMVNALRTGTDAWYWNEDDVTKTELKDLEPLVYDYALERVAMQRALELTALYNHTRPDGNSFSATYKDLNYSYKIIGENIAKGQKTVSQVQTDWEEEDKPYDDQGHRRNMLDGRFRAFACACAILNGTRYWVQEFSDAVQEPEKTPAADTLSVGSIRLNARDVTDWPMQPGELILGVGQREDLNKTPTFGMLYAPLALTARRDNSKPTDWNELAVELDYRPEITGIKMESALRPVWKSEDDSIAAVSADGALTGKKEGKTRLTSEIRPEGSDISFSVSLPVTVQKAPYNNTPVTVPVKRLGERLLLIAPGTTVRQISAFFDHSVGFGSSRAIEFDNPANTGLFISLNDGGNLIAVVPGDPDADGEITAADARLALRGAVGLEQYQIGSPGYVACNVDGEPNLTAGDARLILRGAVGLDRPESWFLAIEDDT